MMMMMMMIMILENDGGDCGGVGGDDGDDIGDDDNDENHDQDYNGDRNKNSNMNDDGADVDDDNIDEDGGGDDGEDDDDNDRKCLDSLHPEQYHNRYLSARAKRREASRHFLCKNKTNHSSLPHTYYSDPMAQKSTSLTALNFGLFPYLTMTIEGNRNCATKGYPFRINISC